MVAAELEVVECLIKKVTRPNLRDSQGRTPLARAREKSEHGQDTDMLKLLLDFRCRNTHKIVSGNGQGRTLAPELYVCTCTSFLSSP